MRNPESRLFTGLKAVLVGVLAVMLALCAVMPVMAEPTPKPVTLFRGDMGHSELVVKIQNKLSSLNYFDSNYSAGVMDDATMIAVETFCKINQVNFSWETGITPELQRTILEGSPKARPTAAPAATGHPTVTPGGISYANLSYMSSGDTVRKIQEALRGMNYFTMPCEAGVLDEATLEAIELFCKVNQIAFDRGQNVITVALQQTILEGSPRPYVEEVTPSPVPTTAPTAGPTPFPAIVLGLRDSAVSDVQRRLKELNCFLDGEKMTPGEFDTVTEEALKRFCEANNAQYMGLTEALYLMVMDEKAAPWEGGAADRFPITYMSEGSDVLEIQVRLNELGYFRDYTMTRSVYDADTAYAVSRFCEVNHVPVCESGVDEVIYNKLMDKDALPNPRVRSDIALGDDSDDVSDLQRRLVDLGYYGADLACSFKCDADMMTAVKRFVEQNNLPFDGEKITVVLQDAILDEKAAAYVAPVVEEGFMDKSKGFLVAPVNVFGMALPMYVLILLGVVVLAGVIVLLIHAFSSGSKKEKKPVPVTGGHQVEFTVVYCGQTQTTTLSLDMPLRLGREEMTLPIDRNDRDMSRHHCQLYFRDNALILRDYSANGTFVNGVERKNCECVVNSGDEIRMGNHTIYVNF